MVLCRQVVPGVESEQEFYEEGDASRLQEPTMLCDCTKIIGRDNLKTNRARKFYCKSKRIRYLSQPKNFNKKYSEKESTQGKLVEVTRAYEEQTPVRIKLLAYPKVRKLVPSRDANKVDKQWYKRFEDLIQRSMLTMYSRMANVQLPDKTQRNKLTRSDWKRHLEWLKKRALPKTEMKPQPIKRNKVPLNDLMETMFVLSRPRFISSKYRPRIGYVSSVKYSAKCYEPTERIRKLAEPKHRKFKDDDDEFEPFQVNPNALTFKPTERIKQLATAKVSSSPVEDSDFTPFGVLKRALKAKCSQRALDLSKPKQKTDDDDDEDKPLVNPKALKAKPTPRIIQLAEPRPPIAEKHKF